MAVSRKLLPLTPGVWRCGKRIVMLSTSATSGSAKEMKEVKHPSFEGRDETSFPCLTRLQERNGPVELRGAYGEHLTGYKLFKSDKPYVFKLGGVIPCLEIAYETWGELNSDCTNAILVHTGLSASSHACSHNDNKSNGWWEKFIGPGRALDTDKFYIICSNIIGGCYGSSGPSSINPVSGEEYGMSFPVVSVEDMVSTQALLLDHLGIRHLHASVGASLGGMQSILTAALFPDRVGRVVSISACLRTHPTSIALCYVQRRIVMSDPNWNKGRYYGKPFPRIGMQHAREVATIGYRSGPEWASRFGHRRANPDAPPDFCPDFMVETYLDRQGEKFCASFDPNSLLYISKAMDMFNMQDGHDSLVEGVEQVKCPVLEQQREMAATLKEAGNEQVTYCELSSIYGHDSFLLDVSNFGVAMKGYLESEVQ